MNTLRLFNSCIFISNDAYFFLQEMLHLQLKLSGEEDFQINLNLICVVRPLSLTFQNHLDKVVWFLIEVLEKECLWK